MKTKELEILEACRTTLNRCVSEENHSDLRVMCANLVGDIEEVMAPYPTNKPDVSMEVATHSGKRLKVRGKCEKCNAPTNWVVNVMGRCGAYWCGCGN
jgi:hypothetical protein